MKRILLFGIIMMLFFSAKSQEPYSFSDVVECEGSVKELYNRAIVWFGDTYNSAQDVIQTKILEDDKGVVSGRAVFKYDSGILSGYQKTSGYIKYTVKISVKKGRYKFEITDFVHDPNDNAYDFGLLSTSEEYLGHRIWGVPKSWYKKVWDDLKLKSKKRSESLIISIKEGMKKEFISEEDDW